MEGDEMHSNSVRTIRWLMAGFGLLAGTVLLVIGSGLIGGILIVMAGLRIAMLLTMERRMRALRSGSAPTSTSPGRGRAGDRDGGGRGEMLKRLARQELDVAATAIGISSDELGREVQHGRTISAVAADAGIPSRRIIDAVMRDATARIERGVSAGWVPVERGRMLQSRLPDWAEKFVLTTPVTAHLSA
jgi:hypothetical protein